MTTLKKKEDEVGIVTTKATQQDLKNKKKKKTNNNNIKVHVGVVGNKRDLSEEGLREVSEVEGVQFSLQAGLSSFIETSAKENLGIQDFIVDLVTLAVKSKRETPTEPKTAVLDLGHSQTNTPPNTCKCVL